MGFYTVEPQTKKIEFSKFFGQKQGPGTSLKCEKISDSTSVKILPSLLELSVMNGYWQNYLQNAFRTKIRAFHQAFLKPRTALYLKVKSISVLSCIAFVPVNNVDSTSL